jgi:SAM-dependent methyltransferase
LKEPANGDRAYLVVDEFLRTFTDTQAVAAAIQLGVVDALARDNQAFDALQSTIGDETHGLHFLLELLRANGVVELSEGTWRLTARFREALRFRDLLEAKIDFANIAAADLMNHFAVMIRDPQEFQKRARMFQLFSYGRCYEYTPENHALTQRWMRFTTALTRHEAGVCMSCYDFSKHRRIMDVGGNSGEFALQICKRHRDLRATVFDLPLVCDIGREHVCREQEAARIDFISGDALADRLPSGRDLVSFKSMLHDWPDREARHFLANAAEALAPGGTLLIFERGRFAVGASTLPYSALPLVPFAHSYREPGFYVQTLEELGFSSIAVDRIELEMPFFLITGAKAGASERQAPASLRRA